MIERWQSCMDGWYEVSSLGRVRRARPGCATRSGFILSQRDDVRSGYPTVSLKCGGVLHVTKYVHSLVAEAFIGPRPDGLQVNHKNGIKADNRADNLEYLTPSENRLHAFRTGLQRAACGERVGSAKLDDATVLAIRADYAAGLQQLEIARSRGMRLGMVHCVVKRKTWRHL